ncbi:hypothetical protein CHS0354_012056 [Potamilus streckersoni]|uniref:Uncharacterized protein n=2 Tax=Potamilus streckersoni TaxID=2493646 RepID=A0AAE0SM85_9BIVA|nr:hypothetical protein CHS0354_012056 [Potamilus streckersoni]
MDIKRWRHVILIWVCFEVICFGGIQYGWGALVYILKDEGIHDELCIEEPRGGNSTTNSTAAVAVHCPDQDARFNLYYSVVMSAFMVFVILGGTLFSKFGTRIVRLIFICMFWAGCLMTAFTTTGTPWLICPGLIFVAGGGFVFILTSSQVANLYSKRSSTVLGTLNGLMDSSSVIQQAVKLAYGVGIKRQMAYFFILGISGMSMISTFLFFPKTFIKRKFETKKTKSIEELTQQSGEEINHEYGNIRSYLCDPLYISHVVWFTILYFRFNYFIGTVNSYINIVTDYNTEKVSYFTNVLSYTMFCGVISSLCAGLMYDQEKERYSGCTSEIKRKLMPALIPMLICTTLQTILSGLVFVPNENVLYVSFIVFTIFRSYLFSVGLTFIAEMFPTQAFGTLYSVLVTCGGVCSLVQFGLYSWSQSYHSAFTHVNILMLILGTLAFIHPTILLIKCRESNKQIYEIGKMNKLDIKEEVFTVL